MGANSYIQKILQRERILQHTPAKVKSLYMKNVWAEKWHPQSYFLTSFIYNNSLEVKNVVIPNILYLTGVIIILTAGRAKNEIPKRAHREAISLPFHVWGTASPYPTVQRVIWKYQSKIEKPIVEGFGPYVLFTQGSESRVPLAPIGWICLDLLSLITKSYSN